MPYIVKDVTRFWTASSLSRSYTMFLPSCCSSSAISQFTNSNGIVFLFLIGIFSFFQLVYFPFLIGIFSFSNWNIFIFLVGIFSSFQLNFFSYYFSIWSSLGIFSLFLNLCYFFMIFQKICYFLLLMEQNAALLFVKICSHSKISNSDNSNLHVMWIVTGLNSRYEKQIMSEFFSPNFSYLMSDSCHLDRVECRNWCSMSNICYCYLF